LSIWRQSIAPIDRTLSSETVELPEVVESELIQPFLGGASRLIAVARNKQVVFGTGPVGSSVARLLQSAGYEVLAIPTSEYGSDPQGVQIYRGDPTDFEFVLTACTDASAIFL